MRGLEPCNVSLSVPSLEKKQQQKKNKQTKKYRKRYAVARDKVTWEHLRGRLEKVTYGGEKKPPYLHVPTIAAISFN